MNRGKYKKTLAKFQVRRDIQRNVLPKFIGICMETPCWCPQDGHQHDGQKLTETSVTKFWYKSMNSFLEEFINIKVILFLIHLQELLR